MGDMGEKCVMVLVKKKNSECKKPIVKPSCRWKMILNWGLNGLERCGLDLCLS